MIRWIADVFSLDFVFVTAAIGVLILMTDRRRMNHDKLRAEAAFSRIAGWSYIIGSPALWVISQIAIKTAGV